MSTILKDINGEIYNFRSRHISIVEGLRHNQYELIRKIYFYYHSRFMSGEVDEEGDRKYFYNITSNPCKIFTKAVDFDTKNIKLLTAGDGDPLKTWFMERDLEFWMRDKQFGKILNRIFGELPIFGSVVLKIVDGTPHFVDLRNFVVEQSADTLDQSNYIIESHNYTVPDFRAVAKKMGWKQSDVDSVVDLFHKMKDTTHIRLFERYGEVREEGTDGTVSYPYKRVFIADVGIDEYDQKGNLTIQYAGVELGSDVFDGNPYWEFHAQKIPGRWLAVGIVEALIEPQVRFNELKNLQAKASYWAALRLFYSADPNQAGNLMVSKANGDVLTGDAPITQIDMSDRNLAFFNEEESSWNKNISDITIAFAPVGHSVIAVQIAQDQVTSYFGQIQENIALDVKEMLFQVIIPQFEKDSTPEHTLRLVGQDLDTYASMIKNELVLKEMIRLATTQGKFVDEQDRDAIGIAIEAAIKQGKEKILTVPKGFYTGVKYGVDIDITGESVDVKTRYATKFAILQAMTADPTMTTDPVKRKFLFSMAEDGGLSPADFFDMTAPSAVDPNQLPNGRAGGGVSSPIQANIKGPMQKTM